MCEISALERKQTETKEHEVEIGSVSKRGGGSTSGVQGHHKPQHVSAQQCQQGRKFSTHWESISQREWRTWKEAYRRDTAILHLVLVDLEPSFKIFFFLFFFFFFVQHLQAGGSSQVGLPRARPRTCGQGKERREEKRLFWVLL